MSHMPAADIMPRECNSFSSGFRVSGAVFSGPLCEDRDPSLMIRFLIGQAPVLHYMLHKS